jgi:hypothetical protein
MSPVSALIHGGYDYRNRSVLVASNRKLFKIRRSSGIRGVYRGLIDCTEPGDRKDGCMSDEMGGNIKGKQAARAVETRGGNLT